MELEKFEIDGSEFAVSTIINYSSLIQLLSILVKKCNSIDTKLDSIDKEMIEKEQRLSNVETLLNINNDQPKYIANSPTRNHKENSSVEINDNISNKKEERENSPKKKQEKIELNYTMFSELYKRVKTHDKSIKNINNIINTNIKIDEEKHNEIKNNTDLINSNLNCQINKLNEFMEKVNEKINDYDNDLEILKDKLKDFNLYDIFKYQNLGAEVDSDYIKNIIMNLESKMNKKFILYDEKIKLINKDVFKLQEGERNDNAIISGYNNSMERLKQFKEDINQKYNNINNTLTENINDINKKIKFFESKFKKIGKSTSGNYNEDKNNENKDKESNTIYSQTFNHDEKDLININDINFEQIDVIKKIKESLNNLDKYCKDNFNEINIDEIQRRLLSLEKSDKKYLLFKGELNDLKDKIIIQDIKTKDIIGKEELIMENIEQYKTEISQLIKKIDFWIYY